MHLTHLEVDAGFLSGLKLDFQPGLNVVIGPRGSGKTSIVELVRYALGSEPLTERARGSLRDTIAAVLKDGEVFVGLENEDGELITVRRSAHDESPRVTGAYRMPIVLAQNEMEAIGLSARSRLDLLDRFRKGRTNERKQIAGEQAHLASLTSQIRSTTDEMQGLREQASTLPGLREELSMAAAEEQRLLLSADATRADRDRLRMLQDALATRSVRESILLRSAESLENWHSQFIRLREASPKLEAWPDANAVDSFSEARDAIAGTQRVLGEQASRLHELASRLEGDASLENEGRTKLDEETRILRERLENIQQGAGALSRRVQYLREQVAQAEAISAIADTRAAQLADLIAQRRAVYAKLDLARRARYQARANVARRLTLDLAPLIRVDVISGASDAAYRAAIEAGLRGSGMHSKSIVPQLANALAPIEMAEAVESDDGQRIATAADISLERAVRAIQSLRAAGTDSLVAAVLDDEVTFSLLDGADYKTTEDISTGQRCTVVLAIVLSSASALVIVDQPEDHLDNAYVVETLVSTLKRRAGTAQTIATTHNPNIPVLGDAAQVTVLGSDGTRGYEIQTEPLMHSDTIEQITKLMEGGREAFRRRAEAYGLA